METCYMCDRVPTSREHIPPLCIFPEKKDLPIGYDFRKNLITVPSCDEHNLCKSDDDEYLNLVILGHFENNLHSQRQFSTKQMRAFRKNRSKYSLLKNPFHIFVRGQRSGGFVVDRPRLERSLDHVARGLYFYHFNEQWLDPIRIMIPSLIPISNRGQMMPNFRDAHMYAITNRLLRNAPAEGENPEIFEYKIHRESNPKGYVVLMLFYKGFEVAAFSIPSVTD